MKRSHPYTKPLEQMLVAHGVTDYEFGSHSKHKFVSIHMNGQTRRITFPSSPSDAARGLKNTLAFTRRTIRTLQ